MKIYLFFCPRWGAVCTALFRMCADLLFAAGASLFFFILVLPSQVNNTTAYLMRSAGCASAHPHFTFMLGRVQAWEAIFRYSYTADKRWEIFHISCTKISYFQSNVGKLQPSPYSSYFQTTSSVWHILQDFGLTCSASFCFVGFLSKLLCFTAWK